ncbi:hypothetical protein B0J13DRAFT_228545 [Dactylonectria estremocensis]|uniref:Uncharacterized protein n=1 Tax=Dactylonectria estremocensis TaxID=1079267 RepID=A0A9P9F850_9HYPO|nr:hypothetical protein B0J13DRAFT_228545 [Dactylonectria estremocensis]
MCKSRQMLASSWCFLLETIKGLPKFSFSRLLLTCIKLLPAFSPLEVIPPLLSRRVLDQKFAKPKWFDQRSAQQVKEVHDSDFITCEVFLLRDDALVSWVG